MIPATEQPTAIRDPTPSDENSWRRLWSDYSAFYESSIPEIVTARTWRRILDPESAIFGRLAMMGDAVVGFNISVLHEGTWILAPICYLEDLYVDPEYRGHGCGKALILDLLALAKSRGWSGLYWHTRANNPARRLYDSFATADDFVRYRLKFK